ncbi:hypothetical protein [Krasilnikovia sp. MM14-A1259]|uniref:hypothetical protein n=1 Tax=Krasilnikovia sp. MM14-A1259 TaxID=3373539 RepID=UPI0037FE06A9
MSTNPALDEAVRRLVGQAPPLSPAKRIQLAVLLRPDLPVGIQPPTRKRKAA